jgi:hypothetical protein
MKVNNDYIPSENNACKITAKMNQKIKGIMRKPKSKEEPKMV